MLGKIQANTITNAQQCYVALEEKRFDCKQLISFMRESDDGHRLFSIVFNSPELCEKLTHDGIVSVEQAAKGTRQQARRAEQLAERAKQLAAVYVQFQADSDTTWAIRHNGDMLYVLMQAKGLDALRFRADLALDHYEKVGIQNGKVEKQLWHDEAFDKNAFIIRLQEKIAALSLDYQEIKKEIEQLKQNGLEQSTDRDWSFVTSPYKTISRALSQQQKIGIAQEREQAQIKLEETESELKKAQSEIAIYAQALMVVSIAMNNDEIRAASWISLKPILETCNIAENVKQAIYETKLIPLPVKASTATTTTEQELPPAVIPLALMPVQDLLKRYTQNAVDRKLILADGALVKKMCKELSPKELMMLYYLATDDTQQVQKQLLANADFEQTVLKYCSNDAANDQMLGVGAQFYAKLGRSEASTALIGHRYETQLWELVTAILPAPLSRPKTSYEMSDLLNCTLNTSSERGTGRMPSTDSTGTMALITTPTPFQ